MISPPDQDDEDNDEWSPFPLMALLTEDDDQESIQAHSPPNHNKRPPSVRRDWGIPTFQDQMDRGIRSFQLQCLEDDDNDGDARVIHPTPTVVIHLHRLHSTGSDLWDSALVLAHALPRVLPVILQPTEWMQWSTDFYSFHQDRRRIRPADNLRHKTVLELGSGTGAVGLYCAKCLGMKHVIITDQRDNLSLIRKNCVANQFVDPVPHHTEDDSDIHQILDAVGDNVASDSQSHAVTVCALDWTDPILPPQVVTAIQEHGLDLIVGSDLFLPFAPDLLVHLADRLAQILSLCHHKVQHRASEANTSTNDAVLPLSAATVPVAILAYEERFDCSPFFTHAASLDLSVEEIDSSWLHPKFQDAQRIHVLRITYMPSQQQL